MLLPLALLVFGFSLGVVSMGIIVLLIRSKDEALTQDLLDRITARTPGDYLTIIHFRKEHMVKKPGLLFDLLKKKPKVDVPSVAEVEMSQAKAEAARTARGEEFNDDIAHAKEYDQQQDRRFRQNMSTVIP